MQEGIVLSAPGGGYKVLVGDQRIQCSLRHHIVEADERHRDETKEMPYVDLVAAGDRVRIATPGHQVSAAISRNFYHGQRASDGSGWMDGVKSSWPILMSS